MTTTSTILPAPVQQKFSAKMLSTPQARLIHRIAAVPYKMTDNSGYILRMRRYTRLQTAPVPVNPAMMNPPAQLLTAVDIDATINWYATYSVITKEVTLQNQDPVLNQAAARLGQSLRETEDQLIRDMLEATASLINCVGGTNGRQNGFIAVLKSSLMDSKLLPSNVGDNEAQAIERCAA